MRGGVVAVPPLKEKIEERPGKPVALSAIYRILARNGWPSWRRTQQYTYAYGAVSPQDGCFDSLVLSHANSDCMQIFLDEIAGCYPNDNVVIMVLDGAG